jgi:hypothetical protein
MGSFDSDEAVAASPLRMTRLAENQIGIAFPTENPNRAGPVFDSLTSLSSYTRVSKSLASRRQITSRFMTNVERRWSCHLQGLSLQTF